VRVSDRHHNPEWLSPAAVAARWGIDADTVRRNLYVPQSPEDATPAGKLRAAKMFGQYRISRAVVEAFERIAFPAEDGEPTQAKLGKVRRVERRRGLLRNESIPDHIGNL
jgi:hypothetical protein